MHGALMAREDTCELYVRLLCQYEPRAVLPFLQSHGSYRCPALLMPDSCHIPLPHFPCCWTVHGPLSR